VIEGCKRLSGLRLEDIVVVGDEKKNQQDPKGDKRKGNANKRPIKEERIEGGENHEKVRKDLVKGERVKKSVNVSGPHC